MARRPTLGQLEPDLSVPKETTEDKADDLSFHPETTDKKADKEEDCVPFMRTPDGIKRPSASGHSQDESGKPELDFDLDPLKIREEVIRRTDLEFDRFRMFPDRRLGSEESYRGPVKERIKALEKELDVLRAQSSKGANK